jgi:hypothetical protein
VIKRFHNYLNYGDIHGPPKAPVPQEEEVKKSVDVDMVD